MRYLCFDIGAKRTGIATGDDETGIAGPVDVIECAMAGELVARLAEIVEREGPDMMVVGYPLNMDGTEGPQAEAVRTLAEKLGHATGVEVILHDERLSTDAAHASMARTGLTHRQKKARRDALAAAAILQDYLNTRSESEPRDVPDDEEDDLVT